ncbi:hypothetical protein [Fibrella arboris]|uniref:hypothetical protein n=1 Tax=Fibrella arboris TaxID=3242486 RepID=UPI00352076FD
MYKIFLVVALLLGSQFRCYGQSGTPALPDTDYAVYSAVIDDYSGCANSQLAYQRGRLLFINTTTVVLNGSTAGFSFDFKKSQESIEATMFPPKDQDYKRPDWALFFNTVDTAQFTSYLLSRLPVLACRQSAWWTPAKRAYYFNRQGSRGYYELQKDYPTFGGLIQFSKVAYSSDGTKATCYYSESNESENGAGYVIFLEAKEGKWQLVYSVMLWIS